VKVCELRELNDFEHCKRVFGEWTDAVEVIFFGGDYGKDDTHITPLGETPGVVVQAYTYFSMIQPRGEQSHWLAWAIDIGVGFAAGIIFHIVWYMFHHYHKQGRFAPQVVLVSMNFMLLTCLPPQPATLRHNTKPTMGEGFGVQN
jgi:hypothetical protein